MRRSLAATEGAAIATLPFAAVCMDAEGAVSCLSALPPTLRGLATAPFDGCVACASCRGPGNPAVAADIGSEVDAAAHALMAAAVDAGAAVEAGVAHETGECARGLDAVVSAVCTGAEGGADGGSDCDDVVAAAIEANKRPTAGGTPSAGFAVEFGWAAGNAGLPAAAAGGRKASRDCGANGRHCAAAADLGGDDVAACTGGDDGDRV